MKDENKVVEFTAGQPALDRPRTKAYLRALRRRLPKGALGLIGAGASVALFVLAAYILGNTLSKLSFADVAAALQATRAQQILGALLFTVLSYAFLTGYDVVALRQIGATARYRTAALASFASYAISFNLGLPVITGGAVRFWIYSREQLSALQVATITLFAGVTFWLGMTMMIGVGLIAAANALTEIDRLPALVHFLLGVAILGGVGFYCIWTALERRHICVRGLALDLPGLAPTLAQLALGAGDLCCAAGALYLLLPGGSDIGFLPFVTIYVFACLLGVVSHAPGGIGVFEATMLHAIPSASHESLLASLLLFRVIYYFLPFIVALAILGADEGARRWGGLRDAIARIIEANQD